MNIEITRQESSYFAQSDIESYVNGLYADRINRGAHNIGKRATTALRHHVARKNLNGQDLEFELPDGEEAIVRDADSDETYFHESYLEFATDPSCEIEGLRPGCLSGRFLKKFVEVHLLNASK